MSSGYDNMKDGVLYRVKNDSDQFNVGDQIRRLNDGSIFISTETICWWVENDLERIMDGVEYEVDLIAGLKLIAEAASRLQELESWYGATASGNCHIFNHGG